ncbi:MAG: MG2 domain-containing protein, partial [Bdellovibrionota bacterium]
MTRIAKHCFAATIFLAITASQSTYAFTVERFSPDGLVRQVRQVRAVFSEDMVPMGRLDAADPFAIECSEKGGGKWIDPKNWVFDFERDLPTRTTCNFKLKTGLKSLAKSAVTGPTDFSFTTGMPSISRIHPGEYQELVTEQAFVIQLDGEVDAAAVLQSVEIMVEGIQSRIPVAIVSGSDSTRILEQTGYLEEAKLKKAYVIQAVRAFPEDKKIRIRWLGSERVFEYKTRPPFKATLNCERENANSPCIPISAVSIQLSSEIRVKDARNFLLRSGSQVFKPMNLDSSRDDDEVTYVQFAKYLPPLAEFQIEIPKGVVDIAGRPLANESSFPLKSKTADFPPLIKFAAAFGILEKDNPVLPVTVRNVEENLKTSTFKMRSIRLSGDEQNILKWMKDVREHASGWNDDRSKSVFAKSIKADVKSVPKPLGRAEFEVVGIPLGKPGFYVVEIESSILGKALIENKKPMFVATTALVTDLGVHMKTGVERSLVWVTRLSDGTPVKGATVRVSRCKGEVVWTGKTDENGLVFGKGSDPDKCEHVAAVTAGDDFSFTSSSSDDGIESWRFNLGSEYDGGAAGQHTVLSRSLLRAGEKLHMKHFFRRPTMSGFSSAKETPKKMTIEHTGSGESIELKVAFDKNGTAINEWDIPKQAKLGEYRIRLGGMFETGKFRVEEFRLPLMKGVVRLAATDLVDPSSTNVQLDLKYLSGGPAADTPVLLRYAFQDEAPDAIVGYEEFGFDAVPLVAGTTKTGDYGANGRPARKLPPAATLPLKLDRAGTTKTSVSLPVRDGQAYRVDFELEYQDPSGQTDTISRYLHVWPTSIRVGASRDDSFVLKKDAGGRFVVLGIDGTPRAGAKVEVDLYRRKHYSVRRKIFGGFYSYDSSIEVTKMGRYCEGKTDQRGLFSCAKPLTESGDVILQAKV